MEEFYERCRQARAPRHTKAARAAVDFAASPHLLLGCFGARWECDLTHHNPFDRRAAEASRQSEVGAAVVLQSAWRGKLQRMHLATLE